MPTPETVGALHDYLDLLLALLAIGASLWKGRWILKRMNKLWHQITGTAHVAQQVQTLRADLAEHRVLSKAALAAAQEMAAATLHEVKQIRKELQPNGGGSLHDLVLGLVAGQRARDDREDRPLFWTDAAGACTHANRAYRTLAGRELPDLIGTGWVNFIHPEDRPRVLDAWRQAVVENRDFEEHYQVLSTDGVVHHVAARACRVMTPQGRTVGYYGELIPIT